VRWDLDNLYLLCSGCHTMRNNSWHKDPNSAVDFVKRELGEDKYHALRMRANTVGQKIDLWSIKVYLEQERAKIKEAENGRG
jgi:hypothetical protein